ncbi:MAG: HI1506-related protein [Deltaproteobacteria bacterium]|nr:HI1506-related protein [Deltaproteobacteria bacterium]
MMISVRSIPKTFRRAGKEFTDKPRKIDVDEETLAVLKAEPLLVVEVLPEEPVTDNDNPETASEKKTKTGSKTGGK